MSYRDKLDEAEIAFELWYGRESTDEEYNKLKNAARRIKDGDSRLVITQIVVVEIENI